MKIEKNEENNENLQWTGSGKYSLLDHMQRFHSNEECLKFLAHKLWGDNPECPRCKNNEGNTLIKTRKVYKCRKCRKQFSILHDTPFYRTNVPLTTWFSIIYLLLASKKSMSSYQIAELVGVSQTSAWRIIQKIREALRSTVGFKLRGDVESDESEIKANTSLDLRVSFNRNGHLKKMEEMYGPTPHNRRASGDVLQRGRKKGETDQVRAENQAKDDKSEKASRMKFGEARVVHGMIERGKRGRLVLVFIGRNLSKRFLFNNFFNYVSSDSTLFTDGENSYNDAKHIFKEHKVIVKKRYREVVSKKTGKITKVRYYKYVEGDRHVNTIENAWKHLKALIRSTHIHLSTKHAQRYLDEFVFKWNHRHLDQKELFESFFDHVSGKYISMEGLKGSTVIRFAA